MDTIKNHHLRINSGHLETSFRHKNRMYVYICLNCLCTFCVCINMACQGNPSVSSSPAKNNQVKSLKSNNTALPVKDSRNTIECDIMADRMDELDSLILRQGQAAKQALAQSRESCAGNSAVDCNFWTGRAEELNSEVRGLRQQYQKLTDQRTQNGCPF